MTGPRARETLPDVLRALALVAVLVVNAIGYSAAPEAPHLGLRTPPDSAWAAVTHGLVAALLQGKGSAMLAFVLGMALWLAARGRARPVALQRGVLRHRRMLQLGIVHGVFIYFGDILTMYALVGRQLLRRLHRPWGALRRQLWHALALALLAKLLMVLLIMNLPERPIDPSAPTFATVHGLWPFLKLNVSVYAMAQLAALLLYWPLVYLCMVCGVAAARLRLLTHRRWRTALRRGLWRVAPPLLVLSVVYGWGSAMTPPTEAPALWLAVLGELLAIPVAGVYVVALALVSSGGTARWCRWLTPLGQRTLTLYIGHSLVCVALWSGLGLALPMSTTQTVLFSLGLWLLAVVAARLSGQRRWPLEVWITRSG